MLLDQVASMSSLLLSFRGISGDPIEGVAREWWTDCTGDSVYMEFLVKMQCPGRLIFTPPGATVSSVLASCESLGSQGLVDGAEITYVKLEGDAARSQMNVMSAALRDVASMERRRELADLARRGRDAAGAPAAGVDGACAPRTPELGDVSE